MGVNILLVDDRPANLLALRALLEELGHNLVEARSGEEALTLLRKVEFAVVLLDVQMPGMDGFEAAQHIRALEKSKHTPIIFISAHDTTQDIHVKAYGLGAVDYLVKPLIPQIVRSKVNALVDLFQQTQIARRHAEQIRLLVEGTKDYAIFMLDPEGYILTWNPGAERLKGYSASEIIGQHFSRFFPEEDVKAGKPQRALKHAVTAGKHEEEGWRVRKDGTRFWANALLTAIGGEDGKLRGFAKITRDMTERKHAEENARRLIEEEGARRTAEAIATEARLAQREERRQREQFHVTLSSIGDAVIATDTEGNVTFLNRIAETLTGWTSQDAIGKPVEAVFQIVHEESRATVENPVTKALREGRIVGLANHTVLIARSGAECPIDDSAAPIRGEDGKILGVVLVFRDVTEARSGLETRMRLAAIVESSEDAIISQNLDGTIVSWNKAAERLYGYSAEEMVGKPLAILVPPDHFNELPEITNRLRSGEGIEHFETVRTRKDGTALDVSLTISPVRNADGKVIGTSKIARDITATKRHAQGLHFLAEASKVLSELVDVSSTLKSVAHLAVPYFADWCTLDMLEEEGGLHRVAVSHVDPAKVELAEEIYRRFPPDRNAPAGVWNILRTGQSELLSEIPDEMLAALTTNEELLRMLRELGLRSYMAVPLSVRGKPAGVISFAYAESGRRYESADLRLAEDLAHRAAIGIENAQLYSELKRADRLKDEFLAMLAHELRNPLAPIRNSLYVLKQPNLAPPLASHAHDMAERQVGHMARLLDDLLDVSRVSRGQIELRMQSIDLAPLLTKTIESARPIVDTRRHELTVTLSDEPLWVNADSTRLEQIVTNLLNNACKYTNPGGHIWLSTMREDSQVVIRVRDTGIGIAPEMRSRIFDLFVQAERRIDRSQGGVGIGLTLVRRLVELHGGTVEALSAGVGQGSEFVVRLPRVTNVANTERASESTREVAIDSRTRRVMVVDDNQDAADSLAMLLKLEGQDVRVAYEGTTALKLAGEFRPHLVFLDLGMPRMDGYEVARHLRQNPNLKNVVLVALTGWGQAQDRQRSSQAGFELHLVKPVDLKSLQQTLTTL